MASTKASGLSQAVLVASCILSFLYGLDVLSPPSYWRMATKAGSTSLLAVYSLLRGGPGLLSAALALGSAGDAFLSWDGETAFLAGLGSFLLAHILYIPLFSRRGGGLTRIQTETWRVGAAAILVALSSMMIKILVPRVESDLRLPILVYSTTIAAMVLSALTLESDRVIAGAISFTVSDSILAAERFLLSPASPHSAWMQYAVWILYYAGQGLIALGLLDII